MERCKPEPASSKGHRPLVRQHGPAIPPWPQRGRIAAPRPASTARLGAAPEGIHRDIFVEKRRHLQLLTGLPPPRPGFRVRSPLCYPKDTSSGPQRSESPRAAQPWDYAQIPLIYPSFHHSITKEAPLTLWGPLFN